MKTLQVDRWTVDKGEMQVLKKRFLAAACLAVASLMSGSALALLTATPAAAEGVCGKGASESGIRGDYVICVVRKTGLVFLVQR